MYAHPSWPVRAAVLMVLVVSIANAAGPQTQISTPLEGLHDSARVVRDEEGIPHIYARNEHDLMFLQGWVHAQDRLFQMDMRRRQAEGTVAELLGSRALASDVQLRIFGMRRAAERSRPLLRAVTQAALEAYADGVNSYVAHNALPPEYGVIEIATFRPWSPVDSISVAMLQIYTNSFDLSDIDRTTILEQYRAVGAVQGFDGTALFFEDMNRVAPFNKAATVPDAYRSGTAVESSVGPPVVRSDRPMADDTFLDQQTLETGAAFLKQLKSLPWVQDAMRTRAGERGSNEFVVAGRLSSSGQPILANDPHQPFTTPSVFYENHLNAPGFDAIGASLAGAPYVLLGHNDYITWGATDDPLDLTDVYQEQVVADPASPSGFSTVFQGALEHIVALPQVFRVNVIGDGVPDSLVTVPPGAGIPANVFIVPRRNQGPILRLGLVPGPALSVQYTGFSGNRDIDAFRSFNLARTLDDFVAAVKRFDGGSFNWAYADVRDNIAYFAGAKVPLREDLQSGSVAGLPPYFIRNGQGGNEWLAPRDLNSRRSLPFQPLPFDEMPRAVNPPSGFLVNANNDPSGTTLDNNPLNELRPDGGILYLGTAFDTGIRAGRIEQLLAERLAKQGRVGPRDLEEIQADVVLGDAQFFAPYIVQALRNAQRPDAPEALRSIAADARVQEAVARLAAWDYSTPTGLAEGFDAGDKVGQLNPRGPVEISNSVAATIYSVWRNQFLDQTLFATLIATRHIGIDSPGSEALTALQRLLENFATGGGVGASGIDFFAVPGIDAAPDRRDLIILRCVSASLDLLSGSSFAQAFNGSTNQQDYRWGRLHRVTLVHPLGEPFSIPTGGAAFPQPLPGLPGIPVDGGLYTVDDADSGVLSDTTDGFMFSVGPGRRYVSSIQPFGTGIEAVTSLAGGESGVLGSPAYANLLPQYLVNEAFPLLQSSGDVLAHAAQTSVFVPGKK
jgi:penicillin amidase